MRRKAALIASVLGVTAALVVVATALASTGSAKHSKAAVRHTGNAPSGTPGGMAGMGGPGGGGPGGPGGGAVHSVSVVLNKGRTAYITETTDQGTIESVNSSEGTITIVEGSKSVTYKTVTLTIPSEATITLDGKTSSLSDLAAKDRVTVSSSSEGTTVQAMDSSFKPEGAAKGQGTPPQAPPGEAGKGSSGSEAEA